MNKTAVVSYHVMCCVAGKSRITIDELTWNLIQLWLTQTRATLHGFVGKAVDEKEDRCESRVESGQVERVWSQYIPI
jgi:hypothetical protein